MSGAEVGALIALALPRHLGLAGAALVDAESMGVPLPGETALIAAAVLAHRGHLAIGAVIAVAAAAAIAGDNAGYLIGRRGGRWLLTRPGPLGSHRRRLLERGERFFARHGPRAVFVARFVAGARATTAWLAGVNRMPWRTFLLWNALGGVAWAVAIGLLGFFLGAAAERLIRSAGLGAAVAVLVLALAVYAWQRRRARRRA
jgi:membrane protein DedA with SNARE-associated domain